MPANGQPTISIAELERELKLDEHALEAACLHQPELNYQISRMAAAQRSELRKLERERKDAEARALIEIKTAADDNETKITVDELKARVQVHPRVVRAYDRVGHAEERLGQLEALRESYHDRRDMLKELVQLHLSHYYGDPIRGAESQMQRRGDMRRDMGERAVEAVRRDRQRLRNERGTSHGQPTRR